MDATRAADPLYAPRPTATKVDVERWLGDVETVIRRAAHSDEPLLAKMVGDLIQAGGKRLRPRLALLAFAACGGTDPTRVVAAAAAGELIHTASLVHDDIIDRSPLRRGRPTLHVAYGIPHALVAGDFLFTQGFALAGQLPPEVVRVNADACIHLAEGEVLEQRLLDEEVTEESYLRIIRKKTAEPMRACLQAGSMLADAPPHIVEELGLYGLDVGIAFQIADDVLDIAGDPKETGKTVGQDARTGVLTLPVGLGEDASTSASADADRARSSASEFRRMARTTDPDELRRALQEAGAIDRARGVATKYVERAKARLAVLPDSEARDELAAVAESVVKRRK